LGARPIPWKEHLALAVGRVCGCRVYSSRSTGKVQFVVVGREVNRVVAQMYYEYLLSAIERLLQENLCGARKTSAYKSEFKRGAAVGLATRLGLKMQAQLAASSARELAANERLEAEISEVAPWLISAKGARRRIARTGAGFDAGVGVPQTVEVDTHLGEQAGPPKFILRLDF
jgi:hypothetical protein